MSDDRQDEIAFLRQREAELRQELRDAESAFGAPVNDDTLAAVLAEVMEALRRSGNDSLATQYAAAFERVQTTRVAVDSVDGADQSAIDTMNDAQAEFERISAAVNAWFDARLTEGGLDW